MKMIDHSEHLERLSQLKDKQVIKVLTSPRCHGKTTILEMFREKLLNDGMDNFQIIFMNFEDMANGKYLDSRINGNQRYYIFLDEVQAVTHFEKVLDSFFIKKNVDIYVTG